MRARNCKERAYVLKYRRRQYADDSGDLDPRRSGSDSDHQDERRRRACDSGAVVFVQRARRLFASRTAQDVFGHDQRRRVCGQMSCGALQSAQNLHGRGNCGIPLPRRSAACARSFGGLRKMRRARCGQGRIHQARVFGRQAGAQRRRGGHRHDQRRIGRGAQSVLSHAHRRAGGRDKGVFGQTSRRVRVARSELRLPRRDGGRERL